MYLVQQGSLVTHRRSRFPAAVTRIGHVAKNLETFATYLPSRAFFLLSGACNDMQGVTKEHRVWGLQGQ